ncbi:MAG: threonine/serine exporter family protein, partial [Brachybacterium sp.]|nr:threonine/serine exporter family protein [Brachybacterium sp.]
QPTVTSPIPLSDSLTVRSEAAAAVGSLLLSAGMASYRVKWAMARTARALGLDSFVSLVTFTDITATATLNGRYRTRVTQPEHVGVDVDRLARTQRFVETLPPRITAAEVHARLEQITARSPLHSRAVNALAAGVACAAFSFLNNGGPVEMLCVLIAATLGQAVRRTLQLRHWNHLLITLIAGVLASSVYLGAVGVPNALGWIPAGHQSGYVAAVLFLVPGFPLITGLLDVVRSDFSAGIARLAYASLMILGAAASIWTVGLVAGAAPEIVPTTTLPFALELPLRAAATFFGVLGFAVLFNSPWRIASVAAAISLVANSLRFTLTEADVPVQLATLIATVLIGVASYGVARTAHVPRPSLSVPAVVIMIPGFTIYSAYTMMNAGQGDTAIGLTAEALQIILAAALGLALAHLATSPSWRRVVHPR